MSGFILCGLIGLVVGGCLGVVLMAVMFVGSKSDDQLLGDEQYK